MSGTLMEERVGHKELDKERAGQTSRGPEAYELYGRRFVTARTRRPAIGFSSLDKNSFHLHHCSLSTCPVKQQVRHHSHPMQSGSIVYAYVALGAQAVLPIVLGSFASVKVTLPFRIPQR